MLIAVTGQFKNIKEVQNDLMGFINADTILVGHGLENDLRALNLIHGTILDTAVVFPHFNGLPFRRSLRSLVSSYLKRDIQVITPPPRPLVTCHHIYITNITNSNQLDTLLLQVRLTLPLILSFLKPKQ